MNFQILRYLKTKENGSASASEIIQDLGLVIEEDALNVILENLGSFKFVSLRGRVIHDGCTRYDLVRITEAGKQFSDKWEDPSLAP